MKHECRFRSFLNYAAKCVSGTLAIYSLTPFIGFRDIAWALISLLLILSPDGKDTVGLALSRIKANSVGATVGVTCLLFGSPSLAIICVAITLVLAMCYILHLDTGIRSALAATVIVMLHPEGIHFWDSALSRVVAVISGCAFGLLITWAFHFHLSRKEIKNEKSQKKEVL